jgi:hypothetical protein
VNPALLAMIRDGVERLAGGEGPAQLDMIVYGLTVALIGLACVTVIGRRGPTNGREWVFLVFLCYALVLPRFKDYSYILLIPPSVYVVVTVLRTAAAKVLALALLCTHFFAYQSWVAALVLFTALLAHLPRRPRPLAEPPEAAPGPA